MDRAAPAVPAPAGAFAPGSLALPPRPDQGEGDLGVHPEGFVLTTRLEGFEETDMEDRVAAKSCREL